MLKFNDLSDQVIETKKVTKLETSHADCAREKSTNSCELLTTVIVRKEKEQVSKGSFIGLDVSSMMNNNRGITMEHIDYSLLEGLREHGFLGVLNYDENRTEHSDFHEEKNSIEYIDFNEEKGDTIQSFNSYEEYFNSLIHVPRIKLSDVFEEMESFLMYDEKPILSRRNILTIQGKAKSTKTFLMSALCTSGICGEYMKLKSPKNLKILCFDTEQCKEDSHKILQRIKAMAEKEGNEFDEDRFFLYNLRTLEKKKRIEVIEQVSMRKFFDIIIIDGARDLISDINSPSECDELVCKLLKICDEGDCSIVTIIHENKNDDNARGHIGTELMNKSETVIKITKEEGYNHCVVTPELCRHEPFEKFSYSILLTEENIAIPVLDEICYTFKNKKNQKEDSSEKDKKKILDIMEEGKEYPRSEIYKLTGITGTTGSRRLEELIEEKKLIITSSNKIALAKINSNTQL